MFDSEVREVGASKDDIMVLLKLDEVYRPGVAARKFVYSETLAAVVAEGSFFEVYPLDSDERFFINEVATYCELLATIWEGGIVDRDLAQNWYGAALYWKLIGPILIQSRVVFDSEGLWTEFEALALAQTES